MREVRRSLRSQIKLSSMTKRRAKRYQLLCELLEPRQLMASDVLSAMTDDACPVLESELSGQSVLVAKQMKQGPSPAARFASDGSEIGRFETKEKPTHSYFADGVENGMVIHPTRVAVKFTKDSVDAAKLTELGLTFVRPVNSDYSIYETAVSGDSDVPRQSLGNSSDVENVVPVFVVQSSNSEAVLIDEIIIALKSDVTAAQYFNGNDNFSAYRPLPGTPDQFIATVASGTGEAALAVANQVTSDSGVAWVAPNFYQAWQKNYIPNDTRFGDQWNFHNVGQGGSLVDVDVDLPEAWDINPGGSSAITIGIIDDGVSLDHPDLDVWVNPGETAGDFVDNDGNGWVDDVNGWNFVADNNSAQHTSALDGHGTSTAGIAAAKGNNNLGVAGASYNSKVIGIKIFEGNSVASDANIASALYYAAGRTAAGTGTWNAASIVSNSWSGGAVSAAINAALTWGTTLGRQGAGATYFFSTGNGFSSTVPQPAAQSLNIPGVIAVGATNNMGELSDYSNYGAAVDLVATSNDTRPGYLNIDTTDRVGADGYDPSDYTGTGANGFGGTSASAPLAAGIGALVLAQASVQSISLNPDQLRSLLRNNTDLGGNGLYQYSPVNGKNNGFGFGRINAASAVGGLGKAEISLTGLTEEYFDGTSTASLGSVVIGETQDLTLRVRNQGTSTLDLTSLTIASGPFTVVTGFGDSSLALGEATSFTVRFTPTVPGLITRTVTILSNDLDEAVFTFDLSATAVGPSIGGVAFEDWDGDGTKEVQDINLAGRSVYLDSIPNGVFDSTPTTISNTTGVLIFDESVVLSTQAVSGLSNFVTDINVRINITHTWNSDMIVTLVAPNGTRVILANRAGGSADNFTNTVFDDQAATSIQSGVAPFTGSFQPFQPLSVFNGLAGSLMNGDWSVEIEDVATGDEGTLTSWDLVISTGEQVTATKANGFYSFLGLPIGSHTARTITPSGWGYSGPTGGHTVIIASASDYFVGRDFGSGQNDKFYGQVFNDVDGDGVFDSTEVGLAGRELFIDKDANGVYNAPGVTTLSNTTPVSILDLATVTSTTSSTVAGLITDVNVRVNITHTFNGDLDVFLVHPDGTVIELFTDVGGSGQNFVNTVLDQQATGVIGTTGFNTAPFTGSFRPEGNLSLLNGKTAVGDWVLRITDDAGGDAGTLTSWDLTIVGTGDDLQTTSATGTAAFNLAPGANQVRLAPLTGFVNTVPTDGLRTVTPTGVPLFDQRYGSRSNSSTIVTRGVFYAGATGTSAASSLATDKAPLLPGQASTFANYTNYSRGLNGLVIDVAGLPVTTTESQMAASLQFANWNGIAAAGFVALPGTAVPTVTFVTGGASSSQRVRITFPDNTVQNTWLRVTVLANAATALQANDVFYFGNVIGELDFGNTATRLRVNGQDAALVLSNQSPGANSAPVTNKFDLDRNGRVNGQDYALIIANQQAAGIVAPITAPSARPAAARGLAESSGAVPLPSPGASTKSTTGTDARESQSFASTISNGLFDKAFLPQGSDSSTSVAAIELSGTTSNSSKETEKEEQSLKSVDSVFASLWGSI